MHAHLQDCLSRWLVLELDGDLTLAALRRILHDEALLSLLFDGLADKDVFLDVGHDVGNRLRLQVLPNVEE